MIRCNLSVLLAEQSLKITKVSKDTGISRTTLTSLATNNGKGIQFDTMNQLCLYLKVTPEQFISFVPVDIEIEGVFLLQENPSIVEISFDISERWKHYECSIFGEYTIGLNENNSEINSIDLDMSLSNPGDNECLRDEIEEKNMVIINAFKKLTRPFLSDIEDDIYRNLLFELTFDVAKKYNFSDDLVFNCNWPKEFLIN